MYRPEKVALPKNPVIKTSFLGRLFYCYLKDLFKLGLKRPLEETDIYEILDEYKSAGLATEFKGLWREQLKTKNPSLMTVINRSYGYSAILWGFAFCFTEVFTIIAQPLFLGGLVSYFAPGQTDITLEAAYWYAAGIVFCAAFSTITLQPFIFWILKLGIKLRVGCCALLYDKTLKLSKSTAFDGMNGQIINLMTNDVAKFDLALLFLHDLWKGPMVCLLVAYFLYHEIGISGVIGMAFMLAFVPIQAWLGKKSAQYRLRTAKRTDIRVRFMNEIIQGIQVIKMYTWEKSFATMVDEIRRKEVNVIRGTMFVRAVLYSFLVISRISIFLSLVSYAFFGNVLTARKVFVVSSFFNILNTSMVYFWPIAVTTVAEGWVSIRRIQEYLMKSEVKEQQEEDNMEIKGNRKLLNVKLAEEIKSNGVINVEYKNPKIDREEKDRVLDNGKYDNELAQQLLPSRRIETIDTEKIGVTFNDATAIWTLKEKRLGILSINLDIVPGNLCAVIGPVGSGKSTLLNAMVGELELDDGSLIINGRLSYAPQEPWLFEGSIRRNILFIEEYDEERYREVCRVCALERDFELLPHGDATIVGERGMVLSGGQKARVSLARAVYKRADIYLLDDPLSAVDTHVGKHIFNECIDEYLKEKCVVLVTHQLQYLKDVQHIVLMEAGHISAQGSFEYIKSLKTDSILSLTVHEEDEDEDTEVAIVEKQLKHAISKEPTIDPEEEKEACSTGAVSFDVYKKFLKSIESVVTVVFTMFIFVAAQVATSGLDYFVAQWCNWEEQQLVINSTNATMELALNETDVFDEDQVNEIRQSYMISYTILALLFIYTVTQRNVTFFLQICLKASINLHDKLFRGITRATMDFFNTNPSGRILNRFSKDIGNIDTFLPNIAIDSVCFFVEMTAIAALVAIVNPWFLVPTFIMSIVFYMLRVVYINTSRSVNRIESLSRSPVFSHMNATIQGLSTIRAFKAQDIVSDEFYKHQDKNSGAMYLFFATARAFALYLDLVCVVYIAVVSVSFLMMGQSDLGGNVGLAVSQVIGLIGLAQWGMRQTAELENKMVSVERVVEYAELPSEPSLETLPKYRPPTGWPEFGVVEFKNLSLRYSPDGNNVLKDLTFRIEPREKIGIVGRTGAGKSSIIQALFRLAELEGTIEIDGVDTKTLGLHDLRSKVAIIPQDPILFSGTMRNNLDPFKSKSDEQLWNALEQVELKVAVSSLAGGLDCKMSDGGSNFSMGQRQLVCLARAILLHNKILVLDEATANVDPETDKLIQTTIRTKFAECTVLTIAHRLHTVMDSDRVLVMDAGQVAEFAHPFHLLQRPGGILKRLVEQTGATTSNLLFTIARENFENKQMNLQNK